MEYIEVNGKSKISIPDGKGGKRMVEVGVLDSFAYPLIDLNGRDTGEELVVSTTRLETMIGDTAVAIHPEDQRYKVIIFFPI